MKFPDTSRVDYKAVKERAPQVIQLYETAFAAQQKVIKENFKLMQEGLEEQIRDDNNLINQIFLDLTKGPCFCPAVPLHRGSPAAQRDHGPSPDERGVLWEKILQPEQMNVLEGNANAALNKIRNGSSIMAIRRNCRNTWTP